MHKIKIQRDEDERFLPLPNILQFHSIFSETRQRKREKFSEEMKLDERALGGEVFQSFRILHQFLDFPSKHSEFSHEMRCDVIHPPRHQNQHFCHILPLTKYCSTAESPTAAVNLSRGKLLSQTRAKVILL